MVCLQVLFTAELNRRLAAAGIPVDALCLHPGNVLTEVVRSLPPLIQKLYRALLAHILFTPPEGRWQVEGWMHARSKLLWSSTTCVAGAPHFAILA